MERAMFVQGVKEPSTEDAHGIHVVCSVFRVWFWGFAFGMRVVISPRRARRETGAKVDDVNPKMGEGRDLCGGDLV